MKLTYRLKEQHHVDRLAPLSARPGTPPCQYDRGPPIVSLTHVDGDEMLSQDDDPDPSGACV